MAQLKKETVHHRSLSTIFWVQGQNMYLPEKCSTCRLPSGPLIFKNLTLFQSQSKITINLSTQNSPNLLLKFPSLGKTQRRKWPLRQRQHFRRAKERTSGECRADFYGGWHTSRHDRHRTCWIIDDPSNTHRHRTAGRAVYICLNSAPTKAHSSRNLCLKPLS